MEQDWAGTYTYTARVERPRTTEELQEVVRGARAVRALGTRHTFNGLADSPGVLVDLTALPDRVQVRDDGTVAVTAGTTFGALARELQRHGRALHNLGSLPHISVGGAVATGTHGSGDRAGALATAVRSFRRVGPDGEVAEVSRDDVAAQAVALGSTGVVTELVLATEPTYDVRQDVYRGAPLADVAGAFAAGDSVSAFTRWDGSADLWVKTRLPADVPDELLGAPRDPVSRDRITDEIVGNVTPQGGVPGPWHERLPHFRHDATPSNGDEVQSEFFVDRADTTDVVAALAGVADRFREHLVVGELRTVAADDLWLSMAHGRDSLAVHFTWRRTPGTLAEAVPLVTEVLAPFGARPHWGKAHPLRAAELAAVVPCLDRARELFDALDPDGVFASPSVVALGVRSGR
ncbi:FAD-binding protein [Klenkia brasiliensis]|uniref:Xylitol oxidase n=1 Tax=Klenkia brasiliensis TaxID=333142 RepID=A0A1G7N9C1_9ACTN|nr:FAD-binding protein [Klenkia brasiliensis]SDF70531.1 xylitol oxidase [Klenkia brasiliensis]